MNIMLRHFLAVSLLGLVIPAPAVEPPQPFAQNKPPVVAGGQLFGMRGYPVPPTNTPAFFPFIDTFGQYRHRDWPGKTHALADLHQQRDNEVRDLAATPGPGGWDQYGGWQNGPQLRATGFFRTEKYHGKWWFVDPTGRLFWSHGIDCVGALDPTPIDDRDGWFADPPFALPEFQRFNGQHYALHGHYAGRTPRCFSFASANLLRKYGPDWETEAARQAHRRLRSWGLNTIGNWSRTAIAALRRTPYVGTLQAHTKPLAGDSGYWGKFPDVFDPSFQQLNFHKQLANSALDPWCLGYFVDNELSWGGDTSLAVAALQSPADQPAKQVFLADLQAKYGTIAKLNAAWGTNHASWEALRHHDQPPDKQKAGDDLRAFYTKTAETYFKTIRDALQRAAPGHLYLGCRFAWVNERAAAAAAKYCDVVSYNLYRHSVADFRFPGNADVPLIIGEFHFGALDRGMFHTGLVRAQDQADRARLYQAYVHGALHHPQFIGTHWFKYQDEPTTGRALDEENYQIGFVDVADTPYPETLNAARAVGNHLYQYRLDSPPRAK